MFVPTSKLLWLQFNENVRFVMAMPTLLFCVCTKINSDKCSYSIAANLYRNGIQKRERTDGYHVSASFSLTLRWSESLDDA